MTESPMRPSTLSLAAGSCSAPGSGPFFPYGEVELAHLRAKDPVLGAVIDRIGHIDRPVIPDLFEALVNAIVAQQISSKALDTIWNRMRERFVPFEPATFAAADPLEIQQCGMTMRKAGYIVDIARRVDTGELDLLRLGTLPDEAVVTELVQLPGIGTWTAEMLLTFSLLRPNVMSYGDLAIQRGLRMVYHHRAITPKLFAKYKRRFAPYATTASLYLWAVAGGALPDLHDCAPKAKKPR